MIYRFLSLLFLACLSCPVISQQTIFFDDRGNVTNQKNAVSFEYRIDTSPNNFIVIKQKTNKDTISVIKCISYDPIVRSGITKLFYPNGRIQYHKPYTNNKLNGTLKRFYPNGKLMSMVEFIQDSAINKISFNNQGSEIKYIDDFSPPKFMNKSLDFFRNYLVTNISYPGTAIVNGRTARFTIEFTVTELGKIDDVKIIGDIIPELNNEVIRVIEKTDGNWIPSQTYGEPTRYKYSMIVNFMI